MLWFSYTENALSKYLIFKVRFSVALNTSTISKKISIIISILLGRQVLKNNLDIFCHILLTKNKYPLRLGDLGLIPSDVE